MHYFVNYKLVWKTETQVRYGPQKYRNINKQNRENSIISRNDLKYDDLEKQAKVKNKYGIFQVGLCVLLCQQVILKY